jgi:hypothetical protein
MSDTVSSVVNSSDELSIASTTSSTYVIRKRIHLHNAMNFVTDVTTRLAYEAPKRVVSVLQKPLRDVFDSVWAASILSPTCRGHLDPSKDKAWVLPPIVIHGLPASEYVYHLPFLIKAQYAAAVSNYPNLPFVRSHDFLRKLCIATMSVRCGVIRFLGATPAVFDSAVCNFYCATGDSIVQNIADMLPKPEWVRIVNSMTPCVSLSAIEYEASAAMASLAPNILEYSALLSTGAVADLILAHTMRWMKSVLVRGMTVWQARAVGLDNEEIFEMAIASATIGYSREYLAACINSDHFLPAIQMCGQYEDTVRSAAARAFAELTADFIPAPDVPEWVDYMPEGKKGIPIEPTISAGDIELDTVTPAKAEQVRAGVQSSFAAIFQGLPERTSSVAAADADSQA